MIGCNLIILLSCFVYQAYAVDVWETTKIMDNVYSMVRKGDEYYSMFVVTSDGVIAFEPVSSLQSKNLILEIEKVTDKKIKYLLTSHNHWDHANGGGEFKKKGAISLVHAEAYEWMALNIGPDLQLPDEKWYGTRKDLTVGDTTVQIHYLGMNHGAGMSVFILPKYKLAYISDIVVPYRVLFNICPDFNYKEQLRSIKEVEKLDFDRAVFTHNYLPNAASGGNKTDVTLQIQYMEDLKAEIYKMLKEGKVPPMDIPKKLRLPKYSHWYRYDDWLAMNAWAAFLADWMGSHPWRPPRTPPPKSSSPIFTVSLELLIGTLFSYIVFC